MILGGLGTTGDYQDTKSIVENNLFVNCDGDAEIISIKSSSNEIRYNTVRTSNGVISSRAGNNNQIYGNFILANGKGGGIKIQEQNIKVYNNYIEKTDSSGMYYKMYRQELWSAQMNSIVISISLITN
jgi:poly(beta-D-mannuronate) lyase